MTTQILRRAPSTGASLAKALSGAYAYAVASLAAALRPKAESPAEAAQRLRSFAESYADSQPSFAADLRAAADRHEHAGPSQGE